MHPDSLSLHYTIKKNWMASHVKDAPFPTKESLQGLALYQSQEQGPSEHNSDTKMQAGDVGLTLYKVDCHPLMVRYALVQAKRWSGREQELAMEFFSQLSLKDGTSIENAEVELVVAMENGQPCAAGMLVVTQEDGEKVAGIYDVIGKNDAQVAEVIAYLRHQVSGAQLVIEA